MHVGGAVLELGCPGPPPLPPGTRRPGPPHARPRSLPPRRRPESPRARLFQVPRLDRAGVPGSPTPSFSSAAGTPHLARAIHSTCLPVSAQASCLPLLRPSWWDPIASPASTVICFTWYLQGDLSAGLQAAWLWVASMMSHQDPCSPSAPTWSSGDLSSLPAACTVWKDRG
ncbi:WW domain-binding protein 11-like isoform X2 [Rhinopithecus roxellana]|uniref:WW domain-binding protein 11-like isoform X2 n=1 Tax=Rhinopithecus roxellana TaxID=61622 RepID=UPI0012377414|nr:WW domain-binding protein 11-like isoform X2 [Rhinopithecus roxellana]